LAKYRDHRLQKVSAGTVIRELASISAIINHARKEWGINIVNSAALVRKPTTPKGRDRVLSQQELSALLQQIEPMARRSIWMKPLVLVALETAMRRGELLSLQWSDVDLDQRHATLWKTKNGDKRLVPLSTVAITVLKDLPQSFDGRVFPINSAAVAKAWSTAVKRACLKDVHFHDLRHMAVTRMAGKLPNMIELAAVSGHRSLTMLKRYYHPSVEDLAKKLG
jgi:integrase